MTVECSQIDCIDRPASRASYPQEPIARPDGGADRWRKDFWRPQRLALVPSANQALGILEHLGVGRAPGRGFLLRGVAALVLQFAFIEAHCRTVHRLDSFALHSY